MFGRKSLVDSQIAAEKALGSITDRVEHLETAPPATVDLEPIDAMLHDLRAEIEGMVKSYKAHDLRLDDIEAQARDFTIALSEGIERYDRAERRIKATVQRARKELKSRGYEDPGLEAESYELRDVNADRGGKEGVLPLRKAVGEPVQEPSSVRGVTVEQLQRGRGFR